MYHLLRKIQPYVGPTLLMGVASYLIVSAISAVFKPKVLYWRKYMPPLEIQGWARWLYIFIWFNFGLSLVLLVGVLSFDTFIRGMLGIAVLAWLESYVGVLLTVFSLLWLILNIVLRSRKAPESI